MHDIEQEEAPEATFVLDLKVNKTSTGEKAIGTGWTVAPPEEEESNWGGTTL